jgi:hypothetical protein
MKKYLLIAVCLCCFISCKNTWDDDDKHTFYQSCMDAAKGDGHPENKAKPYCDCLMNKMMEKYPNESDALDHIDSVITDTSMQQCKEMLK